MHLTLTMHGAYSAVWRSPVSFLQGCNGPYVEVHVKIGFLCPRYSKSPFRYDLLLLETFFKKKHPSELS